jgi:vitamin B12 transporter
MNKDRKIILLLCLIVGTILGRTQTNLADSTFLLKEVQVTANRLQNFSFGNKTVSIDRLALKNHASNSLADLLASESQVFIKSYGIAGLSSPSFRGSGAGHTAVLWNGFTIASPMSGQIDFSLVPVNFMNSVKLQFGGSGALWGSGSVGGTVHLNNTNEFNAGTSIQTAINYGSFEDKQQNMELSFSKKKFISSTKFFNHDAKNDFPYINRAQVGKPIQKLENAQLKQYGLLQENSWKINDNQKMGVRLWYQMNDRNIPASMTSSAGQANQQDEFYRSTFDWQLTKEKTSVFFRSALFNETLHYTDPSISLVSDSRHQLFISEAESKIKLSTTQALNIGVTNTYSKAITKNYANNPEQNRTALFASYLLHIKNDTWKASATARKEFITSGANPFTACVGAEGWIVKKIRLRGNASTNYRLPTFNDLYWAKGGNPNLVPESGFSQELAAAFIHRSKIISVEGEITGFSNRVTNWIMWAPDNTGTWSPRNVLSVWLRGLEYDLKTIYTFSNFKASLSAKYHFVFATNEKMIAQETSSLHKQLIYTPAEKANANATLEYRNTQLSFSYNYVGYRYTTSDNVEYLKPYHFANLSIGKEFKWEQASVRVFFQTINLWNESYQVIAYYPLPGRHYQAGISISFNQPEKLINPN